MSSYQYRNVTEALQGLCAAVMNNGTIVESRAGTTMELTHVHVELTHPRERDIQLPGRGHSPAAQIAETMWVLAGRSDVEWLAHYLPRAPQFSDDGKVWRAGYGPRIRHFGAETARDGVGVDQLKSVVNLLTLDPGTRRAVISLWDPTVDTTPGKDIACNNWLHFMQRRGKLDLHVAVRSNDLIWGWSGINAYEWSTLLEVVARLTDMPMGSLHFSISSLHVYEAYWEKARKLAVTPVPTSYVVRPRLGALTLAELDSLVSDWFAAEERLRLGHADYAVLNDPLLQDWINTISVYWETQQQAEPALPLDPFADAVTALHNQKHEAYGDSWMKRGELFSIIPNIARKVDRLTSGKDTDDETQADTAIDLLVYLAKYRWWLARHTEAPCPLPGGWSAADMTEDPTAANALIAAMPPEGTKTKTPKLVTTLGHLFERLLNEVSVQVPLRYELVDEMLPLASTLARRFYDA